jgi:hypothetical protein
MKLGWRAGDGLIIDGVAVAPHLTRAVIFAKMTFATDEDVLIKDVPQNALKIVFDVLHKHRKETTCVVEERDGRVSQIEMAPQPRFSVGFLR